MSKSCLSLWNFLGNANSNINCVISITKCLISIIKFINVKNCPPLNRRWKVPKVMLLIASQQNFTDLARSRFDNYINQTWCFRFKLDWRHRFEVCRGKKKRGVCKYVRPLNCVYFT